MRRALVLLTLAACGLAACAGNAGNAGTASGPAAAAPTYWPEGVPTPPPPIGPPEIGKSEQGVDVLQIAYVPPHLQLSVKSAPPGAYSVIYVVQSRRYKYERLQLDSVTPETSFLAKLEYARLTSGEYTVKAYAKDTTEPLDTIKLQVP